MALMARALTFFFSSRRRHKRYWRDWSFRRVLFRSLLLLQARMESREFAVQPGSCGTLLRERATVLTVDRHRHLIARMHARLAADVAATRVVAAGSQIGRASGRARV